MNAMDHQEEHSSRVVISLIEEIQQTTDLSKHQIASLCRISSRTLYRMCSGKMGNSSFKTFQKIFELYCLFCCVPHHKTLSYLIQPGIRKNTSNIKAA